MQASFGRPLNVRPSLLVVPPALEDIANALMTAERLEDGKTNPYKGTAKVIVEARLKTDTEWHLLDTNKAIKPIIFQPRKMPVFVHQTDASSDAVFMRKKFKFGAEARGAAGYGLWHLAVGSTGA
jgi:phage major head subunit gpT-like protein